MKSLHSHNPPFFSLLLLSQLIETCISYSDSHQRNTRCKLCANEAVSLLFPSFLCSPGSPCPRAQAEDLGSPKHDGTLAASGMAQSACAELDAQVMGAVGCFLAHLKPDDASRKAGPDGSNAGVALWRWERVAGGGGGGSGRISGPMESRQHLPKLSGSWLCPASANHLQCPL